MKLELTKEQKNTNKVNQRRAREYFGIYGNKELVLHHKDETLRHNDIERYIQWNPEDLVVMPLSCHTTLHNMGKHPSEESKQKNREAHLGENNFFYGKKHTDESKKKMREAKQGMYIGADNPNYGNHWYTDGEVNCLAKECPQGFHLGRAIKYK